MPLADTLLTRAHNRSTRHFDLERDSHETVPASAKFARIVGRPGVGKSYLVAALARDLGLPRLDIADQPGHLTDPAQAWSSLRSRMTQSAIVESAGTSGWEPRFWRGLDSLVIVCAASDDTRKARLQERPEARREPGYVRRMLAIPRPAVSGLIWSGETPIPSPEYDALRVAVSDFLAVREERFIGA